MRVLTVAPGPDFSVQDVHMGWTKGLAKAGVTVREFNLNKRLELWTRAQIDGTNLFNFDAALDITKEGLYGQLWAFDPDVVVITSGFFTEPEMIDRIRSKGKLVVMIHTESPYEDDRQVALAAHCDVNVVNDPTNIDRFNQVAPTVYIPHAYDPDVHHARGGHRKFDFSFIGTGYGSRVEWFEQVVWPSDAKVLFGGNWQTIDDGSPLAPFVMTQRDECVDNTETAAIYRSTVCSLNRYRREADRPELAEGWSMGPREVELAACGVFFGRDPRPESDQVFPMLPVVEHPGELSDLLAWAKAHPDLRQRAADEAAAAIADRTFENNAKRLLDVLDV